MSRFTVSPWWRRAQGRSNNGRRIVPVAIPAIAVALVAACSPPAGAWTTTTSMGVSRAGETAARMANGYVFVAGGDSTGRSAERYNPGSAAWVSTPSLGIGRHGHSAICLPDNRLLLLGGSTNDGDEPAPTIYDPVAGRWSEAARPPPQGAVLDNHSAALLPTDNLLVDGDSDRSSTQLYDPAANRWGSTGPKRTNAYAAVVRLANGKILVTGGFHDQRPPDNDWGCVCRTCQRQRPRSTTRRRTPGQEWRR